MSLCDLYHSYHYFVTEESGCLLVGFREDSVTFIVKEVWNKEPVGLPEVDKLYTEMQQIGEMKKDSKQTGSEPLYRRPEQENPI